MKHFMTHWMLRGIVPIIEFSYNTILLRVFKFSQACVTFVFLHCYPYKLFSNYYLQVESLEEGAFYEFRVTASNIAGLGLPSDPSEHFKCEAWTSPEPGESHPL